MIVFFPSTISFVLRLSAVFRQTSGSCGKAATVMVLDVVYKKEVWWVFFENMCEFEISL